jgi:hypothetical protein
MSTDGNDIGEEVMTHQQNNRAGAAVVKTKRNNRGRNGSGNNEQERREYNRLEENKAITSRESTMQTKRRDVIDLEVNSVDDDGPSFFDGVRVDKIINEKASQHVDNLTQRLGGRKDEIDLARKRDFRGSKHYKTPAMAISSSRFSSPSRGNGKRIQGRNTSLHINNNNGTDTFASPALDHARNLQEGNRLSSKSYDPAVNNSCYTKTMVGYMDKIPQLSMGSMNTKRYMQGQAATKRQELSFAPVEGNSAANCRCRQYSYTADAALSARRGSSDRSRKSPPPSYGLDDYYSSAAHVTRNGQKKGFHWYGNEEPPNKKSSGGVSDRYEKTGRTSDWRVTEPRVHDADLEMTIAACEQPFNTNDILIIPSFSIQRARKSIPVFCASFLIYN